MLFESTATWAGLVLAGLLVAMFPANVRAAACHLSIGWAAGHPARAESRHAGRLRRRRHRGRPLTERRQVMPALPWFNLSTAEPDAQVVVMASRLPLRRYRDIPGFLRWTLRIRRQLATTPGVVGYSLDAHRLARTFWTVPAWTGQEAIEAFVATEPHRDAMAAIRPRMRQFRHSLVVHGDGRQRVISPQSVDGRHTSPSEAVWR